MKDWAGGVEGRNWGIRHRTDAGHLRDLLLSILPVLLLAAVPMFYSWVRTQMVDIGYQMQELRDQETALLRIQRNLTLEEETLKNPDRIDTIATTELGMTRIQANQLIMPGVMDTIPNGPPILAMASRQPASESRKAAAIN